MTITEHNTGISDTTGVVYVVNDEFGSEISRGTTNIVGQSFSFTIPDPVVESYSYSVTIIANGSTYCYQLRFDCSL